MDRSAGLALGAVLVMVLLLFAVTPALGDTAGFSGSNAYAHVEFLSTQVGPRPPGSREEARAGEYIFAKLRQFGWQVSVQEFTRVTALDRGSLKKYSYVASRNIIAVCPGKSSGAVLIGAHYDSADFNVPGADDNASGAGVLLELARVLGSKPQENSYILVFFGAEEAGLVGSHYFAENYDLSQVRLMLNLDMVGEGSRVALDGGGKISTPPWLLRQAYKTAGEQGLKPEVRRDLMLLARDSHDGGTSDFSPFLDKWIPSLGLGQGGRTPAHYHQPSDTMQHVDAATLEKFGRLVLALSNQLPPQPAGREWHDLYFPVDTGLGLFILPAAGIRLFVGGCLVLALYWLVVRRRRIWFSLGWIVPISWLASSLALGAGYLPQYLIRLVKRVDEPWFAHPGFYVVLHLSVSLIVFYWLIQFSSRLPVKLVPRDPEVYWAGSLILLGAASVIIAMNRWDYAVYFALWLLFTVLSRFGRGLFLAFIAPLLVYQVHWQLLNSHLWTEFYRVFLAHPVLFSLIYGFGLQPLVMAVLARRMHRPAAWPRLSGKVAGAAVLYIIISVTAAPAYSQTAPQQLTIREEYQAHRLSLQASGKDKIPASLSKALGVQRQKKVSIPLAGGKEPLAVQMNSKEVQLNKERLVTVDLTLAYSESPYMIKLKLRSEQPFTLVNGGNFFPLGKLGKSVKLNGEATGGIYGLVLERTGQQPQGFQLYLKAGAKVKLTLEAQYRRQFVEKRFDLPQTLLKYENWCVFTADI